MKRVWSSAFGFRSYRGYVPAIAALVVYVVVTSFAGYSGTDWRIQAVADHAAPPQEFAETRAQWFTALHAAENGESVSNALARPMNLPVLAIRPPGRLAELSHRKEDLYPSVAVVNGFSNEMLLFRRYELQAPSSLEWGAFDIEFVVLVFLPLAILFLGFDALSSDRQSGRFKLAVASGYPAPVLLWRRVFAANLPLLLATLVIAAITSIVSAHMNLSRLASLVAWMFVASCYWLFWVSCTAFIAAINKSSLNAALSTLTCWVLFVVLLPGSLQFIGNAVYESPSRVHLLSNARLAESEARGSVEQRYDALMADHAGEIALDDENVPDYYRNAYLANKAVNERIRGAIEIVNQVEADRLRLLQYLAIVSPITQLQLAFDEASQSGRARAKRYEAQVREHLRKYTQTIGPATLSKSRLTVAQANSIADFSFQEDDQIFARLRAVLLLLIYSLAAALGATVLARRAERSAS